MPGNEKILSILKYYQKFIEQYDVMYARFSRQFYCINNKMIKIVGTFRVIKSIIEDRQSYSKNHDKSGPNHGRIS